MSDALNLARRPFRNERLPTLVLAAGCLLLAALTARHVLVARSLLPGRAVDVERDAVALETELARLRGEARKLGGGDSQPQASLKEWTAVKELVDRRAFSWTGLFADLEKALPPGVRLVSIAPQVDRGALVLAMNARGREVDDALALLAALQEHPHFRGATLDGYAEAEDGVEIQCRVVYAPARSGAPKADRASGPAGAAP